MKVAMITGSYPPEICGVGDYTFNLTTALQQHDIDVVVISNNDWKLKSAYETARRLNALNPDIVHIQYPTVGYGSSIVPNLLTLLRPCVVTIHEMSQSHILRKLSIYLFFVFSRQLIFTNQFEYNYAKRLAPWITNHSNIVPIGSNIPKGTSIQNRDIDDVIYFGLIGPRKGLENVLSLAALMKKEGSGQRIRIIGLPNPKRPDYLQQLYNKAANLPISWNIGLSHEEVSNLLSRSKIAYVPFPDGASERRGSLLALLSNGVVTITTRGKHTPEILEKVITISNSPQDALNIINKISLNELQRESMSREGRKFAEGRTWHKIAEKHAEIYSEILRSFKTYN